VLFRSRYNDHKKQRASARNKSNPVQIDVLESPELPPKQPDISTLTLAIPVGNSQQVGEPETVPGDGFNTRQPSPISLEDQPTAWPPDGAGASQICGDGIEVVAQPLPTSPVAGPVHSADTLQDAIHKMTDNELKFISDSFQQQYQKKLKELKITTQLQRRILNDSGQEDKFYELDARSLRLQGEVDSAAEGWKRIGEARAQRANAVFATQLAGLLPN
jgi:hypothetical protein